VVCLAGSGSGSFVVNEVLEDLLRPVGLSPGFMAGYGSARGAEVRRAALGILDAVLPSEVLRVMFGDENLERKCLLESCEEEAQFLCFNASGVFTRLSTDVIRCHIKPSFTSSQLMSRMEMINKLYPVLSGRLNLGMDVKATIQIVGIEKG
jgi:hypothetical protein